MIVENIFNCVYCIICVQKVVDCDDSVIAPLIFYSDQTVLSGNMRVSGYPLVLTLGNISSEKRQEPEGRVLLAVLPILPSETGL